MIRLAVRCAPEQAELVLAELTVLAPGGVEEIQGDGYVEYAIYGAEGELPDLGEEEAVIAGGTVEVEATEVADDWADRWRTFHKPLLVGDPESGPAVWIRPPWEPERSDLAEVVVDPGQAFGQIFKHVAASLPVDPCHPNVGAASKCTNAPVGATR